MKYQESVKIKSKLLNGIRNRIQFVIFVFTLAIGFQFYIYVNQALDSNIITVPRPEGVEGFLPIGALMGWKHFILTGVWDVVHPAAMVVLGFAVLISLLLKKSFCSWFCPVGTLSEWVWKIGESKLGKNYQIPKWIDMSLRSLKYILLGFFVYIIFIKMTTPDIAAFLVSPYYKIADVKMLHFFTEMSILTAFVLLILMALSFFFRNFWCRYACPYGALLGLFAFLSPTKVQRNPETCKSCERCHQVCPFHLPVNIKNHIVSPECSGCMDCVKVCPSKNTLNFKSVGFNFTFKSSHVGFWVVIVFLSMVYLATVTGHWKSQLSEHEFRMWLKMADTSVIQHPSVQFGSSQQ